MNSNILQKIHEDNMSCKMKRRDEKITCIINLPIVDTKVPKIEPIFQLLKPN